MNKEKRQMSRVQAHLRDISGEKKYKGNQWIYYHLTKRILEHGDEGRIVQMWDFWSSFTLKRRRTISNFWNWYKNGGVTTKDIHAWGLYYQAVCELCPHLSPTSQYFCQGGGEELLDKLEEWAGSCGNSLDSIVMDYFRACILSALEFNSGLILTGKSFLASYGWSCFLSFIHDLGGKDAYLLPDDVELAGREARSFKLHFLQSIRDELLAEGSLDMYDEIGQLMSEQGIDKTYSEVKEWTK